MQTVIGFLIPEFPGQTHAFFIREREELEKLGIGTRLISTRRPLAGAGAATHSWAEAAARETTYLFPLGPRQVLGSLVEIALCGPAAWLRCLGALLGRSDMSAWERLKMLPLLLVSAELKRFCRHEHLRHVHVHSCANSANLALFARLLGGPRYSLTLHGEVQHYGSNQAAKWRHADFGIVITRELMREIRETLAGVPLPPLFLAPMGVQLDRFTRSAPYVAATPGEPIRLVSCGRLHFVKAHDDLIRAVAELAARGIDAQLTICGATDTLSEAENYQQTLQELCERLGVSKRVVFLGSVPEERVRAELEAAHVFCLASLREPLGVAIMEAMAMQLPVVVAYSPGVSELVSDGVDGILVEPRAPGEIADAIIRLVASPEDTAAMARRARQTIAERFHSGISAARIASGITEATATRLAPQGSAG